MVDLGSTPPTPVDRDAPAAGPALEERVSQGKKETKPVHLDEIEDGDLAAVIIEDKQSPGGFRVAGYCEGRAVPETVEEAQSSHRLRAPCECGGVNLVYRGFSHEMPDVHPWPTFMYHCTDCGRTVSYMRLTAADARRAMASGLGTSDEEPTESDSATDGATGPAG
ncbi:MAG: hypothetical protein ACK2UL_11725 [Anaerolineae bacterium]